jgi:hypothetical protein
MMLCCIPYPPVCVYHPVIKKDNKTKQKKNHLKISLKKKKKNLKKLIKEKKRN